MPQDLPIACCGAKMKEKLLQWSTHQGNKCWGRFLILPFLGVNMHKFRIASNQSNFGSWFYKFLVPARNCQWFFCSAFFLQLLLLPFTIGLLIFPSTGVQIHLWWYFYASAWFSNVVQNPSCSMHISIKEIILLMSQMNHDRHQVQVRRFAEMELGCTTSLYWWYNYIKLQWPPRPAQK